jgi:hypothetical protein
MDGVEVRQRLIIQQLLGDAGAIHKVDVQLVRWDNSPELDFVIQHWDVVLEANAGSCDERKPIRAEPAANILLYVVQEKPNVVLAEIPRRMFHQALEDQIPFKLAYFASAYDIYCA